MSIFASLWSWVSSIPEAFSHHVCPFCDILSSTSELLSTECNSVDWSYSSLLPLPNPRVLYIHLSTIHSLDTFDDRSFISFFTFVLLAASDHWLSNYVFMGVCNEYRLVIEPGKLQDETWFFHSFSVLITHSLLCICNTGTCMCPFWTLTGRSVK